MREARDLGTTLEAQRLGAIYETLSRLEQGEDGARAELAGLLDPDNDTKRDASARLRELIAKLELGDPSREGGSVLAGIRCWLKDTEPPVSLAKWKSVPLPEPVIWRDSIQDRRSRDVLLSDGEVAILAAPGGLGKSTLMLALAYSATDEPPNFDRDDRGVCGFRIRRGPVVIVSYEDAPARMAHRLRWYADDGSAAWNSIYFIERPRPLWQAEVDARRGESGPGPEWRRFWRVARTVGATLVVIDPVSAALSDVSVSEVGPVRAFLGALAGEA